MRHDVAEGRFALRRSIVWSGDDLYSAGQNVGRDRFRDCLVARAKIFVILPRPEHAGGDEKESRSRESGRCPARKIRPPVDWYPSARAVLGDAGHDATLERVPVR